MTERTFKQEIEMTQAWVNDIKNKLTDLNPEQAKARKRELRALYLDCQSLTAQISSRINIVGATKPAEAKSTVDPLPLPYEKWVEWATMRVDTKDMVYHDTEEEADQLVSDTIKKVKVTFELI